METLFGIQLIQNDYSQFGKHRWPSSEILINWLIHMTTIEKINLSEKVIVELGGGTGLVSIWCSKIAKKVFLHDLDSNHETIQANCQANNCKSTNPMFIPFDWSVEELFGKWTEVLAAEDIDFLFGCDVLYDKNDVGNILVLVRWLLDRNPQIMCIFVYPCRNPYQSMQRYLEYFQLNVCLLEEIDKDEVPVYLIQIKNAQSEQN